MGSGFAHRLADSPGGGTLDLENVLEANYVEFTYFQFRLAVCFYCTTRERLEHGPIIRL